jgi:hypothetical protein
MTADLPDEIIGGLIAEPLFQHTTYAEVLTLPLEEAPRALQQKPELHEAFLGIIDFDHNDLDHFDR